MTDIQAMDVEQQTSISAQQPQDVTTQDVTVQDVSVQDVEQKTSTEQTEQAKQVTSPATRAKSFVEWQAFIAGRWGKEKKEWYPRTHNEWLAQQSIEYHKMKGHEPKATKAAKAAKVPEVNNSVLVFQIITNPTLPAITPKVEPVLGCDNYYKETTHRFVVIESEGARYFTGRLLVDSNEFLIYDRRVTQEDITLAGQMGFYRHPEGKLVPNLHSDCVIVQIPKAFPFIPEDTGCAVGAIACGAAPVRAGLCAAPPVYWSQ